MDGCGLLELDSLIGVGDLNPTLNFENISGLKSKMDPLVGYFSDLFK